MKDSFETYLTSLDERMKNFGFDAYSGGDAYHFDRIYHKKATQLTRFGNVDTYSFVKCIESNCTAKTLETFSKVSFDYGQKSRQGAPLGMGAMLVVFPLIALEKIPQDVYQFLINYCPKHWAAVEFPSVLDIETSNLYYYEKTPLWGMAYFATHRKEVYNYYSPKAWIRAS